MVVVNIIVPVSVKYEINPGITTARVCGVSLYTAKNCTWLALCQNKTNISQFSLKRKDTLTE